MITKPELPTLLKEILHNRKEAKHTEQVGCRKS